MMMMGESGGVTKENENSPHKAVPSGSFSFLQFSLFSFQCACCLQPRLDWPHASLDIVGCYGGWQAIFLIVSSSPPSKDTTW